MRWRRPKSSFAADVRSVLDDRRETLAALENTHRATVDELAMMRTDRDQLRASLSVTTSELTRTSHTLTDLEEAYTQIDAALTAALSEIDAKRIVISDLETRLMTQTARGDDFERALGERHSELSDERKRSDRADKKPDGRAGTRADPGTACAGSRG